MEEGCVHISAQTLMRLLVGALGRASQHELDIKTHLNSVGTDGFWNVSILYMTVL